MSADLQTLIARLEAATGGDRELDGRIAYAIEPQRFIEIKARLNNDQTAWIRLAQFYGAPEYTASIDAALTLVPPHHLWQVKQGIECQAIVWMLETDYDDRQPPRGYTTTFPALALCIAALKAHLEQKARTVGALSKGNPNG